MNIDHESCDNALTIEFMGEKFLFMGDNEAGQDFDSQHLLDVFHTITSWEWVEDGR